MIAAATFSQHFITVQNGSLLLDGQPYHFTGTNFWQGEGRPREAGCIRQPGDEFTGDPPFERQGWYSVYDTDTSTLEVVRAFSAKFSTIKSNYLAGGVFWGKIFNFSPKNTPQLREEEEKIPFFLPPPALS